MENSESYGYAPAGYVNNLADIPRDMMVRKEKHWAFLEDKPVYRATRLKPWRGVESEGKEWERERVRRRYQKW